MTNIKLDSLSGKSKRSAKNIVRPGPRCYGSTSNRDRRYDGGARIVKLSSPPAIYAAHVSIRGAQAVLETRKLNTGSPPHDHREHVS
jgi:hypothetical protein